MKQSSAFFPALLAGSEPDAATQAELGKLRQRLLIPVGAVCAVILAWSALAPLSGAVVANGEVKVELNRKTVQHQEGGIVREILVRNGQKVRAGQPLVVIGDVRSQSELNVLHEQLTAAKIHAARTQAEATLEARFVVPREAAADPAAQEHLRREEALFAARRRTLDEQIASLQKQIHEAHAQSAALGTQIDATEQSARLSNEELQINNKLVREGFINRTRLLELERDASDYAARVGEYRGELALAQQRVGDFEARIAQARNQYQQQAADELKDASAKARELEERLRTPQDQVERQTVRSPVDGEVMSLRVSAPGEAIGPREPILDVVPERERLVIEARIRPEDIEHVRKDGRAEVRLTAFDARTVPLLPAQVSFVSADRVKDADSEAAWFVATIEVDAEALKAYPRVRLQPGMPAEVFVTTKPRTLFQYLMKPFTAFTSRALREP
jgi:HlyD family type I secretion membrane fusion protein